VKLEALPLREELEALARYYQHVQVEHQNASPGARSAVTGSVLALAGGARSRRGR
jgi:hypothetical protein